MSIGFYGDWKKACVLRLQYSSPTRGYNGLIILHCHLLLTTQVMHDTQYSSASLKGKLLREEMMTHILQHLFSGGKVTVERDDDSHITSSPRCCVICILCTPVYAFPGVDNMPYQRNLQTAAPLWYSALLLHSPLCDDL